MEALLGNWAVVLEDKFGGCGPIWRGRCPFGFDIVQFGVLEGGGSYSDLPLGVGWVVGVSLATAERFISLSG